MDKGIWVKMQMYYTERLSTYLPVIRKTLRITQEQLAERVGLTRQTIISFEKRQRILPWHTYLALVLYFQQNETSRDFLERFELFDPEILKFDLKDETISE